MRWFKSWGAGQFWTIFDFLKAENGGRRPGAFEQYWGDICQNYVEEIIKQNVLRKGQYRYEFIFDPPYKRMKSDVRGSDIIIFDRTEKELFLFDVTYSSLRIEASTLEDNLGQLSEGFNKLVHKAKQLNTVIEDIKSGALVLNKVDASSIRTYRPNIVTMARFPLWPFTQNDVGEDWRGLSSRLKDANFLQSPDVSQLSVLHVSEVEELCARHRAGSSMFDNLRNWRSNPRFIYEPLQNYLERYTQRKNYSTLETNYNLAFEHALKTLFGRTVATRQLDETNDAGIS